MASKQADEFERSLAGRGIKTVALVLILGSVALMADHAFFFAPPARTAAEPVRAVESRIATDGFALPDNLHPTAADVTAPAPTF